jgi:O-succinylbenzoate synthase
MANQLRNIGLEYFEQPVATIPELRQLRHELEINEIELKIAADESIRRAEDPLRVAEEHAADIAVIKVQPLGGIGPAMQIAKDSGLEIVVSSALESSIGISQGLHLAGALPNLSYDCGLATAALLAADVTSKPLLPINGAIEVREVEPDQELIERYAASQERRQWWLDRIQRCLNLLEA